MKPFRQFDDVCIYEEDYNSLDHGAWITDTIIEFAYEFMEKTNFSPSSHSRRHSIGLLRPAMVHLITHSLGRKLITIIIT